MSAQGLISPDYTDNAGNRVMVIMNDDGAVILMTRAAGAEDWEYAGEGTWVAETPAQCRLEADRLARQAAIARGWASELLMS